MPNQDNDEDENKYFIDSVYCDFDFSYTDSVDCTKKEKLPITCEDCKGTGKYIGFNSTSNCKKCNGVGKV